jgi:hypothetical protein
LPPGLPDGRVGHWSLLGERVGRDVPSGGAKAACRGVIAGNPGALGLGRAAGGVCSDDS